MTWQEVCAEPTLQNLPFKIELDRFGNIVMSPASNWHGILQMRIGSALIQALQGGEVISECSIKTSEGTKVADIAWASDSFIEKHGTETPFSSGPEICLEILSPSNSTEEMKIKRQLYFDAGAKEFWQCDQDGVISFFDRDGELQSSEIAPSIPKRM